MRRDSVPRSWSPADTYSFPVLTGAEWALTPEVGEGAPRVVHGAECLHCPGECWVDDEPLPAAVWALEHTRSEPTHRQYLVSTQKHWRVEPSTAVVATGTRVPAPPGPRTATAAGERVERRPCRSRARRWLAQLGRCAGLLTVVLLSASVGFTVGALLVLGPG